MTTEDFNNLTPEQKYFQFKRYLIESVITQVIITLGFFSPAWLFYFFTHIIVDIDIAAHSLIIFVFYSVPGTIIFPWLWNNFGGKPEWLDIYLESCGIFRETDNLK